VFRRCEKGDWAAAYVAVTTLSFAPTLSEAWSAPSLSGKSNAATPLALVVLGGVGEPHARDAHLRASVERRVAAAPDAALLLLGDVFQGAGLLGFCPGGKERRSTPGCAQPGSADAQLDAILGPRAASRPSPAAVAGLTITQATRRRRERVRARKFPPRRAGATSRGCGKLDPELPLARLDAGAPSSTARPCSSATSSARARSQRSTRNWQASGKRGPRRG
jgi:hypothetical protein